VKGRWKAQRAALEKAELEYRSLEEAERLMGRMLLGEDMDLRRERAGVCSGGAEHP